MNLKAIVRVYTDRIRPRANEELDWFSQQSSLQSAIEYAALAINRNGKRYHHQRRLQKTTLEQSKQKLLTNARAIEQSKDFDDLFTLIDKILEPVWGIGELYVYDTALRIGAKLNLLPKAVYLHAGTRQGAKALGFDGKATTLNVSDLPADLQPLEPHEIEDVFCIFKDDLKKLNARAGEDAMTKRSWCA
ncbi:MAG: hypothetical protein HY868_08665 [Chloroflexi bacterium]|nr:hypothetical protein [Chloroflexota bacterium]